MVLEFVEGGTSATTSPARGRPTCRSRSASSGKSLLALQKAHEQGIVHRDIKPENILVTRKVEVKVTDFGLSRFFAGATPARNLTQSGVTLGTPLYMSPEQVQGQAGRPPQRHLLARRDLLPPARRRAAVPRRRRRSTWR